jgi:hypothetical protein
MISNGDLRASPWFPKTIPTYAKALACQRTCSASRSVGHPPVGEIRRSMIDLSQEVFLSGVTHSSTAKAVLARRSALQHAGVVSCVGG